MTTVHAERIHTEEMANQDPSEFRFKGKDLDALLAGFPDDFGATAPSIEEGPEALAQSDAALMALTQGVRAGINERGEEIDKKGVLGDVLKEDRQRRFTFGDLSRRLPFDGFNFNSGTSVLSDNILTTRERDIRVAAVAEAMENGDAYEENVGTHAAREALDKRLKALDFGAHARDVALLALSELCTNTSMHGEGIDGIAGRCEAQYFPELGKLVITAINVSSRPKQSKEDDPRGSQEKGRGLIVLAGFLKEEKIGDNLGRFRYSTTIGERYLTSSSAEVAGIGRTATYACIAKDLVDNSRDDPEYMESPDPKKQSSRE